MELPVALTLEVVSRNHYDPRTMRDYGTAKRLHPRTMCGVGDKELIIYSIELKKNTTKEQNSYSCIEQAIIISSSSYPQFLPSGWIVEPARQDNKVYSIVTYLMQVCT
ncbi:hypothetical protein ElyMa_004310900 [Elysia marginata]|uniref:Uncharacterized protein n=1 Tax=Elysia marginata TaxID=1093978 RepID=A0AAV4GZK9_9GAST|nr:hypothetical protein ElyMa_004310900 [Elysia marginata]